MEHFNLMEEFSKLYTNENIHTDELFDFVNEIDFEKLDYTQESNVFLLFYKISINYSYF